MAVAVNCDALVSQGLDDEVRHDTTVIGSHAWTVGIKNSCHLDAQVVLATIVEEQSFCTTLAFIVAGSQADRIDVAPIILRLGMNMRIPIYLSCRRLQNLRPYPLSQPKCVDGAMNPTLNLFPTRSLV